MMKTLPISFVLCCFVLLVHVPVLSQRQSPSPAKCPLTLDESPTVRGLKLGQARSVVQELFAPNGDEKSLQALRLGSGSARLDDFVGVREQTIYSPLFDSERLKGIRSIELRYLDDKLASFSIDYGTEVKWQSTAHFTAAIADQLQLPASSWGWGEGRVKLRLDCDGFYVETFAYQSSELKIEQADLNAEVAKRKVEQERKKRVEFKP
jgi:hypothetical protein